MTINDKRTDKSTPWAYVVFTDSFMSGWGQAKGGRSLYALAVSNPDEETTVTNNGKRRGEMKRPRTVKPNKDGLPSSRLYRDDHMSVVDKSCAARWYSCQG